MAGLNPMALMSLLRQGNPKQIAMTLIQSNFQNNPMAMNLVQMGERGDTQGLQQFARQYLGQQGLDFNTEMQNLMNLTR